MGSLNPLLYNMVDLQPHNRSEFFTEDARNLLPWDHFPSSSPWGCSSI